MVLFLVGTVIVCAALLWFWKVPVKNLVNSMKKNGSSAVEAYAVIALLFGGVAVVIYLIAEVI